MLKIQNLFLSFFFVEKVEKKKESIQIKFMRNAFRFLVLECPIYVLHLPYENVSFL